MRKQTKVVAVASAAALLAIGGAMTSFAAQGWVEEDGTWYFYDKDASYGKTGQLLRVSGAAVPFRTVRSTAMLARSATGEVNTVIYLYPAC